jgi:hypothetical protein
LAGVPLVSSPKYIIGVVFVFPPFPKFGVDAYGLNDVDVAIDVDDVGHWIEASRVRPPLTR